MNKQAARFIGSIPENYDEGLGPHIFSEYAIDLAGRVAEVRPKSVLELAAGTGIVTRKLRDALASDCELVASDLNPPMLDMAKAKFRSDESITFEEVDATDLQFGDATFDAVACQFGVMFFPDKGRSYREVHRVLKPGGSYIFNVWDSWAENPFAQITHEAVERFFPDDPPAFYRVPFGYHDPEEIRESMRQAGFEEVRAEHVPLKSKIISAGRFAKGLVLGNPLYEEVVTRGGDLEAILAAVEEAIEAKLGSEMPLRALVIQASKS
jgi:ubiquinone/menaquinone biosynthesis C-methylase UbiE